MAEGRLACHRDRAGRHRINGDVPEAGAGHGDLGRKALEVTTVVGVPAAVLEAAEIGVVHQADVAALGAFDDDHVVLVQVLALVYEFHVMLRKVWFCKGERYHAGR